MGSTGDTASIVIAVAMIVLGGLAIYGGNFGRDNVADRLEPQNIVFPPYEAMTPEEQEAIGQFAEQQVVNGEQAKGYSDYINGHLAAVNDGATYSETSAAARERGTRPRHGGGAPRERPTPCSRVRRSARSC